MRVGDDGSGRWDKTTPMPRCNRRVKRTTLVPRLMMARMGSGKTTSKWSIFMVTMIKHGTPV